MEPFMSNREKEVIAIVSDVSGFDEAEITPESNFAQDLEIDSIKAIEITVALEKKMKNPAVPKAFGTRYLIVRSYYFHIRSLTPQQAARNALAIRFKISVRDEDVPNITTVKQAVELVNRLTGQNS
jgi:acyl carrier protein